jgi:hypothetical protein
LSNTAEFSPFEERCPQGREVAVVVMETTSPYPSPHHFDFAQGDPEPAEWVRRGGELRIRPDKFIKSIKKQNV